VAERAIYRFDLGRLNRVVRASRKSHDNRDDSQTANTHAHLQRKLSAKAEGARGLNERGGIGTDANMRGALCAVNEYSSIGSRF
jgi:hypothetical protein